MILAFETSPVKEEEPATDKTREAPQISSSTAMEVPSNAPRLKKTGGVDVKPVLPNLETAPVAPSITEGINKARGKIRDFEDPFNENLGQKTEQLKELRVQNIDQMSSKDNVSEMEPVLSNLETAPTPSMPEGIDKESGEIMEFEDPFQEKLSQKTEQFKELRVQNIDQIPGRENMSKMEQVMTKLETAPAPSMLEGIEKERGEKREFKDPFQEKLGQKIEHAEENTVQNIDLMETDNEELKEKKMSPKQSRRSSLCWNAIAREFPSRKRAATELFTEPKWRSKHWKSSQQRVKSKECYRNEHCSYSFRGWVFLDETICSCIPSDGRPFIDVLEGYLCNPETNQGKLEDAGVGTIEDSNRSVQSTKLDSASPPNKGAPRKPTGQAIKIAIMVGFGLLVFLTRKR